MGAGDQSREYQGRLRASAMTNPMGREHNFRAISHPLRIHSGEDALAAMPGELERLGRRRAFILCGNSIATKTGLIDDLRARLGTQFAGVCAGLGADVDREGVEQAARAATDVQADCLIAIGAGSTTKACRVVAIRMAESGPLEELATRYDDNGRGVSRRLHEDKLPIFNVVTAATTSQNRSGASIRDVRAGRQLEFFDPKTKAKAVFWDANALLTAPLSLTRAAAGMEYWWALMSLAGAFDENPLVMSSRRECWRIASSAMPRIDDPLDWRVRAELCAASLLRTRDEDDGGAPLGVLPGTMVIRMHPIARATYMLGQGLNNTVAGASQSQSTMALAGAAVKVFGDYCPDVVERIGGMLGASGHDSQGVGAALEQRLRDFGFKVDLKSIGLSSAQCEQVVRHALRTFNCNADGWMNDKVPQLQSMLLSRT